MKKSMHIVGFLLGFGLTTLSYAIPEGGYIGLQGGLSDAQNLPHAVTVPSGSVMVSPDNRGFAGRLFGGYAFNPYFTLESGFTYYAPSIYQTDVDPVCGNPRVRMHSLEFMGKGLLPLNDIFDVYAKGGAAFVKRTASGSLKEGILDACATKDNKTATRPVAAVGIDYNFSGHVLFDLSWTRLMKGGSIPTTDFMALGVSFHFADPKCGQFLC